MKHFLISIFLFASCTYHKQEITLNSSPTQQLFELTSNEEAFSFIFSDDYFSFKSFVIANGNILNRPNSNGQILLHEAVKLKRDLFSVLLIKHGANPNLLNEDGRTSFELINGYIDVENWESILNGKGISFEQMSTYVIDLISDAAQDNQEDVIKKLEIYLELGANINTRNSREYTLLMLAATKNLPLIVEFLCSQDGIDINAKAGRYTALSITQKLLRRDPSLQIIIDILTRYESEQ